MQRYSRARVPGAPCIVRICLDILPLLDIPVNSRLQCGQVTAAGFSTSFVPFCEGEIGVLVISVIEGGTNPKRVKSSAYVCWWYSSLESLRFAGGLILYSVDPAFRVDREGGLVSLIGRM